MRGASSPGALQHSCRPVASASAEVIDQHAGEHGEPCGELRAVAGGEQSVGRSGVAGPERPQERGRQRKDLRPVRGVQVTEADRPRRAGPPSAQGRWDIRWAPVAGHAWDVCGACCKSRHGDDGLA